VWRRCLSPAALSVLLPTLPLLPQRVTLTRPSSEAELLLLLLLLLALLLPACCRPSSSLLHWDVVGDTAPLSRAGGASGAPQESV
jgi:hypothetical protein